ncbi:hypothetical protein [Pantoea ananatis]|uniref:hypothetical protein n=1 Tax=Pantoea ananas TaxID=553 RepID=UPI000B800B70|nr:hypothetical protein [Pantoea ananatis]
MSNSGNLKFHNQRKVVWTRLPFVNNIRSKGGYSFWAVPKKGGYFGGCKVGRALGAIYLKHLQDHGIGPGGNLQSIVIDMFEFDSVSREGNEGKNSLKGQVVGFFSYLEEYLANLVANDTQYLFGNDSLKLLKEANHWLNIKDDDVT